ncbi:hypothetical protein BT63DRAFT_148730 [Microthyrium microscopicum]|uniref:Uncharacterized protein n=1 Tax=Microthyrium microscopicum TaxID=703497 RepID=A0A6A6UP36_9PEZI|nr:hypothetical protein BT63DRAFT_148730 [Microthyrium microscopicum]
MFSPEPVTEPASLRNNPRRRRRNDVDSTLRQPRKRSRIASDSFTASTNGRTVSTRSSGANGTNTNGVNGSAMNGHANGTELVMRDSRVVSTGTPRSIKDTNTTLTRNKKFTATSVPAVPDKLKKNPHASFKAFFRSRPASTLAIAVTHESILIWDCTLPTSSPHTKSLSLPYPVKSSEQLPLATLVSNASKNLGLVVVYPTTGKITYWEDIDSAETLKLFEQRRHGVEGVIKLYSGESVEELVDVESAGLIIVTSSGRLAHLTLQDTYGHPQIEMEFLKTTSKSSFFGDIVQVFQGISRNKLSAVKTRPLAKSKVEVIALTVEGVFKIWEVREAGQSAYIGEIESSEEVRDELSRAGLLDSSAKIGLQFVDLAISSGYGNQLARNGDASHVPIEAALLVQLNTASENQFIILDITLGGAKAHVHRIFPITSWKPSQPADTSVKLIIPTPDHTAFIVDEKTVVVVSYPPRAAVEDDEDDEDAAAAVPAFYHDVIHFKTERGGQIIASSAEFGNKKFQPHHSNLLLFTKTAGEIRISADAYNGEASQGRFRLPLPLSKIEQAVFFGTIPNNVVDLYDLSSFKYSGADIETAALATSTRILTTRTDYLQEGAGSMEQHLVIRMKALQDLADFLKKHCSPLSRSAKWKLLSDAERLATARAIWKTQDRRLSNSREQITLLDEGIDAALNTFSDEANGHTETTDSLRYWFSKKLDNLERIFPICFHIIKEQNRNETLHSADFLRLVPQMNELFTVGLGTAYDFRQRNASQYGLGNEELDGGVLLAGFEDLHRFWTSSDDVIKALSWSIKLTHDLTMEYFISNSSTHSEATMEVVDSITQDMEAVIRLSCKGYVESYSWLTSQSDEELKHKGAETKKRFEATIRQHQIVFLYEMGHFDGALALAEEFADIPALVELALQELDRQNTLQRQIPKPKAGRPQPESSLDKIEAKIKHYFRKFGQQFAQPFYEGQVSSQRLADLIDRDLGTKESRTEFLRSDPAYAKISWINEVSKEGNMLYAAKNLTDVAHSRESNAWSRKIELSMAKLALLCLPQQVQADATFENSATDSTALAIEELTAQNQRDTVISRIQAQLYEAVQPFTIDATDEEAKLQNIVTIFASHIEEEQPALTQLLKLGFSDLLSHRVMAPESLIDLLTLFDNNEIQADSPIYRKDFYLALQVLEAASADMESHTVDTVRNLIWKRCIVAQDWNDYGKTDGMSDEQWAAVISQTSVFHTIKYGVAEGFFSPPLDASIPYPSTVLGAGSSLNDFEHRFPTDDLRAPIAKDNVHDDNQLQEYINKVNLDDMWGSIREKAVDAAEADGTEKMNREQRYHDWQMDWRQGSPRAEEEEEEYDEEEDEGVELDYIKEEDEDVMDGDVVQGIESQSGYEDEDVEMEG